MNPTTFKVDNLVQIRTEDETFVKNAAYFGIIPNTVLRVKKVRDSWKNGGNPLAIGHPQSVIVVLPNGSEKEFSGALLKIAPGGRMNEDTSDL